MFRIHKKEQYWIDRHGNKWSIDKFSKKEADFYSHSLYECYNCIDCKCCSYCKNLENCIGCVDCENLANINYCNSNQLFQNKN